MEDIPLDNDNWYNEFPDRIMAFDPGGTTGIAMASFPEDMPNRFQLGPDHHHEQLWNNLHVFDPHVIVTERFDYRRSQKHATLISVEYIGILRLYCHTYGIDLVEQKQLKGHKGLWTDDKLKALDLWIPGKPHAMDATRQFLFYVTMGLGEQYWIEKYSEAVGVEVE